MARAFLLQLVLKHLRLRSLLVELRAQLCQHRGLFDDRLDLALVRADEPPTCVARGQRALTACALLLLFTGVPVKRSDTDLLIVRDDGATVVAPGRGRRHRRRVFRDLLDPVVLILAWVRNSHALFLVHHAIRDLTRVARR